MNDSSPRSPPDANDTSPTAPGGERTEFLPPNWQEMAPLLDAMLDAPAEQREKLLNELASGDANKRAELERLVLACEREAPLLDRHAAERFAQLLGPVAEAPLPETLGGRYRIERELGRGGMACVYLARDLKHARNVAVKVIRPDLAASLGRERFLREIDIAARLRHPNIVPLYDSGDADGVLYFVMPFEEGQSLRERLRRDNTVPPAESMSVLRDVARALAYAHEQGFVHRDIKPDNVMLSGGAAVVTDFGIAKAVSAAQTETMAGTLTLVGVTIGTPAYMAPEQAVGDPSADHRADIYSFGCLAYELFTGHPPFHNLPTHQIIAAHVGTKPLPIIELSPTVPIAVSHLIARCLEKNPGDRPESAQLLLAELEGSSTSAQVTVQRRRISTPMLVALGVGVAMLVTGVGYQAVRNRALATPATVPELTVAVLPLLTQGGDSLQRDLAEGLSDEIMNALTRVPGIVVKSRLGVANYRGQREIDPAKIAQKLGVQFLVIGSFREANGRLILLATLQNGASGTILWSEHIDREPSEIGSIPKLIASAVGDTLRGLLGGHRTPRVTTAVRAINPDAFRLNALAQNALKLRARGYPASIGYFRRAIELDSLYAEAYSGLSLALALSPFLLPGASPNVTEEVTRHAAHALRLDSTLAQPHVALGLLHRTAFDWEGAEVEFKKALALRRADDVEPLLQWGILLAQIGRSKEAITQLRLAKLTEPASAAVSSWLSLAYSLEGQQDSAIVESNRAFESDSTNITTLSMGSLVRFKAGRMTEAHEYARRVTERVPSPAGLFALAATGDTATANIRLRALEAKRPKYHALESARAFVLLGSGDTTRALAALERASKANEMWPLFTSVNGIVFDSVRASARFQRLLRSVRLDKMPIAVTTRAPAA